MPHLVFGAELTPSGWVNDFANLLSSEEKSKLESKLSDFEKKTDIEMTFAIVSTLNDRDIESFANELFKKWGVGKKDRNNGLLIVIAPNERKWRIEIGYGLEPFLTDWTSQEFGNDNFNPNFKEGNYFKGLDDFTTAVTRHLGSATWEDRVAYKKKMDEEASQRAAEFWSAFLNVLLFILGVIFFVILFVQFRKKIRKMQALEAAKKSAIAEYENRIDDINQRFSKHPSVSYTRVELDQDKVKAIQRCNYQGEVTAALRNCVDTLRPHLRKLDDLDSLKNSKDNLKSVFSNLNRLEKKYGLDISPAHDDKAFEYQEPFGDPRDLARKADSLAKVYVIRSEKINQWAALIANGAIAVEGIDSIIQKKLSSSKGKRYELDSTKMEKWRLELHSKAAAFNEIGTGFADFERKQRAKRNYDDVLSKINTHESNISIQNRRFTQIQVELQESPRVIEKLTQRLSSLKSESDISASIKTQIATFIGVALAFKIGSDVYSSHDKLTEVLSTGEKLIRAAESEISSAERQREEERRRRKRREEEEERRRRDSYSSSYSSSWGSSSSSSSSFGGFGGGDSGGGGSSGSW